MPRQIVWTDVTQTLVRRLGKPDADIYNKKSGELSSQRWAGEASQTYGEGRPYVAACYKKDGRLDDVFLGVL